MSKTAAEFLLDRYDDVIASALGNLSLSVEARTIIMGMAGKLKDVVKFHKNWPVLVEEKPKLDIMPDSFETVQYKMIRQMMWLTEQEYVKRFGKEPVTAPLIRDLLETFNGHEDFDPTWLT